MSMSDFEIRVLDLAQRSGLNIASLDPSRARLQFNVSPQQGNLLTVRITPFEDLWEFSCLSSLSIYQEDDKKLFWPLLVTMLERNAMLSRGFWCLQKSEGDQYPENLTCLHNMPENLLTPEEFSIICNTLAGEVADFTEATKPRR